MLFVAQVQGDSFLVFLCGALNRSFYLVLTEQPNLSSRQSEATRDLPAESSGLSGSVGLTTHRKLWHLSCHNLFFTPSKDLLLLS
jgi:hypothetical protein